MNGTMGRGSIAFVAGVVAVGGLASSAAVLATPGVAHAQLFDSDFWLYQPQQTAPVGRAWSNPDRTVEYWAYVVGEYEFGGAANGPGNRWHLDAQRVPGSGYGSYAGFKAAVLALPEMQGKTILFQKHTATEETVGT